MKQNSFSLYQQKRRFKVFFFSQNTVTCDSMGQGSSGVHYFLVMCLSNYIIHLALVLYWLSVLLCLLLEVIHKAYNDTLNNKDDWWREASFCCTSVSNHGSLDTWTCQNLLGNLVCLQFSWKCFGTCTAVNAQFVIKETEKPRYKNPPKLVLKSP